MTIDYFQKQNKKIETGTISDKGAVKIPLDTLGITNGMKDMSYKLIQD